MEAGFVTALELPSLTPTTPWELADRFDGARLRALRLGAGYGARRFAHQLGVTPARVYLWETGRNRPGQHYAGRIVKVLGCVPADLLHLPGENRDVSVNSRTGWTLEKGADLRRRREAANLSRGRLAGLMRIGPDYVRRWETTAWGPSPANLVKVEQILSDPPPLVLEPRWIAPSDRWVLSDRFDGERLRELYRSFGYSVRTLAEQIEADPTTVANWCRGKNAPGHYFAEKLIELFDCDPEDLCRPVDESPLDQPS
jgi:transcriptional regulator with XRE-family HTH domain